MGLVLGVVLTATQLENAHLVVLTVGDHGGLHASAGHQGGANLQLGAVTDSQNLVKHDFLAYVRSNLFYLDFFASSNTILFATGFYDRVHTTSFSLEYLSTDPFLRNGRLYWQTKFAAKHLARPKPPRGHAAFYNAAPHGGTYLDYHIHPFPQPSGPDRWRHARARPGHCRTPGHQRGPDRSDLALHHRCGRQAPATGAGATDGRRPGGGQCRQVQAGRRG